MPARYKVINKHIFRAQTQDVNMGGTKPDGSPNIVRQPMGIPLRVDVGTILDDVRDDELAGAPDRFELVNEEAEAKAQAASASSGVPEAVFAPTRGVHEPAALPTAPVQKPPLDAETVAAVKEATQSLTALDQQQATQAAAMEKERAEAEEKALVEATQKQLQTRGAGGRFQPQVAQASPHPAASAPQPETHAQPAAEGHEGRGRRS